MGTQTTINKKESAGEEHQAENFLLFLLFFMFFVAFCCVCFLVISWKAQEENTRKQFRVVLLLFCLSHKETNAKEEMKNENCNIDITTDLSERSRGWLAVKDKRNNKRCPWVKKRTWLTVIIGNELEFYKIEKKEKICFWMGRMEVRVGAKVNGNFCGLLNLEGEFVIFK